VVEILYGAGQVGVPGHHGTVALAALAARSRMCIRDSWVSWEKYYLGANILYEIIDW